MESEIESMNVGVLPVEVELSEISRIGRLMAFRTAGRPECDPFLPALTAPPIRSQGRGGGCLNKGSCDGQQPLETMMTRKDKTRRIRRKAASRVENKGRRFGRRMSAAERQLREINSRNQEWNNRNQLFGRKER